MVERKSLRPGPADILVTPGVREFLIGQMSTDGREWKALDASPTFAMALRKAHMYAIVRHVRVLVSRQGDEFQLFDAHRLWLGIDRVWHPHDSASIARTVPSTPGVYLIRALTPLFIGDTENLRDRLLYHLAEGSKCEAARNAPLQFCFEVIEARSERAARAAELIDWWSPPCNEYA